MAYLAIISVWMRESSELIHTTVRWRESRSPHVIVFATSVSKDGIEQSYGGTVRRPDYGRLKLTVTNVFASMTSPFTE